ncbi:hypothetical protein BpHYR1_027818 [Brachionus plicatilis]|uniref:Uncharacterized protein n=1 Tax=Brachionus plicatilis TaxID=10195 RepID=A0A3M7S4A2_BRAPC|nr:hypothetical protein BpHYR1_027818 [Brachionus plicatilis]
MNISSVSINVANTLLLFSLNNLPNNSHRRFSSCRGTRCSNKKLTLKKLFKLIRLKKLIWHCELFHKNRR